MGLQFYIGNSGTGKSYTLCKKVLEEAGKNPNEQYIVLVPEQFTMQTQMDFVKMSPVGGILNIDVLSFQRLAYRVFEQMGNELLPVLDEIGKIFVIKKVAEEQKEHMFLMGRMLGKIGYINEIKSMISELMQYDVDKNQLEQLMEGNREKQLLYSKLHDVNLVYEGFKKYLEEKFITSEELLDVLCRVAKKSDLLKNATIVMDGFTGFTPIQKKLIGELMTICKNLWVTVSYDTSMKVKYHLPEYHLFHMSATMMQQLRQMAEEMGMEKEEDVTFLPHENYRFANNPQMASLERNLFRGHSKPYEEEVTNVSIHKCYNPMEEVVFAAEEIRRLVMEKGYRYSDVAIVTGDLATYSEYVEQVFLQYQIPIFSDYKRNALANPVIACIRSLLECAMDDFSYESVGKVWRTGMVPMEQEQLDRMQNYILAKGIRGKKRWSETWNTPLQSMSEETLEELNQWREQFVTPLLSFVPVIRSKRTTILEKTTALFQILTEYDVESKLQEYKEYFNEQGELALAKEYDQIFKVVIHIFDRLVELLGDEKVDGRQYAQLLEAGFAETKVGVIPPGVDQVMIGDIERSRLKHIKALIFLGVNDGIVPGKKGTSGILTEVEREKLKEQGTELAPGAEQQYYTQKFYLYLNLTKPTEHLYMTYSAVGSDGKSLNPSYLIQTIRNIFPKISITEEKPKEKEYESLVAPKDALDYVVSYMREEKPEGYFSIYNWLLSHDEYAGCLEQLKEALKDGKEADTIHAAVAKALYGEELSGNVTRMEQYASCAYAHFLKYGLRAQERQEYGFRHLDFGNILHQVLDLYSKQLSRQNLAWTQVGEEQRDLLVEKCVDEAVLQYDSTVLYYTARDKYRIERMKRVAKRTVWALTGQLEKGDFVPSGYEVHFHNQEMIRDGFSEEARLNLRGRIDRMDICEKDDKVYVKVIDYKTGNKKFKLLNVYYGIQLQLVVYLQAAMKFEKEISRNKEIIPAGILYYHIDDPIVERKSPKETENEIQMDIMKELRTDGIINSDDGVIESFDHNFENALGKGKYESAVIPAATKTDGNFTVASKIMPGKEIDLMMNYTDGLIKDLGEEILSGKIERNPVEDGSVDACTYCAYKNICSQDLNGRTVSHRTLPKLKEQEIYVKMREKVKGDYDGSNMD